MRRWIIAGTVALASLAIVAAASGADSTVSASRFFVSVMDPATGLWQRTQDTVVPLRPGQACFDWQLYIVTESATVVVTETFKAPASPAHWPEGPHIVLRDARRVADVSLTFPMRGAWLDRLTGRGSGGWIEHSWCIEAGDPEGPCVIEVRDQDHLLHRFCFLVLADGTDRTAPRWDTPAECGVPIS
jgi:hypothetical protein